MSDCDCGVCIIARIHISEETITPIKKIPERYRKRHLYGRYEVVDDLFDRPICYGFNSEEVENIVLAMNTQYEKDINEDQIAGELGG